MSIKVVYIIGAGYSGSTVLGAILGMHPNLLDAGELYAHGDRPVPGDHTTCSCGARTMDCHFWLRVAAEFSSRIPGTDERAYHARMARYQRVRYLAMRWYASAVRTMDYQRYQTEALAMFESLVAASEKPSVVDVSKSPIRGLNLAKSPGLDVRFVHLVRNGLALIPSRFKHHGRKWLRQGTSERRISAKAARDWLSTNLIAEYVIRAARCPATRIRYEDLIASPEKTILSLSGTLGEDLSDVAHRVAAGEPISFGHAGGNIAGRQGPRPLLTKEDDWRLRLPPGGEGIFLRRAGWLNRHYGYSQPDESKRPFRSRSPRQNDPPI